MLTTTEEGRWSVANVRLTAARDSLLELGNVLEAASADSGERAVRDVRADFFSDVLRGGEEDSDGFDACIFQR